MVRCCDSLIAAMERLCLCGFGVEPLRRRFICVVLVAAICLGSSVPQVVGQTESESYGPLLSGEAAFAQYCAPCHGDNGRGSGQLTFGLSKPAPDLTQLSSRNRGIFPRERLARVIDGREQIPAHQGREMPVWVTCLNSREKRPLQADLKKRHEFIAELTISWMYSRGCKNRNASRTLTKFYAAYTSGSRVVL